MFWLHGLNFVSTVLDGDLLGPVPKTDLQVDNVPTILE